VKNDEGLIELLTEEQCDAIARAMVAATPNGLNEEAVRGVLEEANNALGMYTLWQGVMEGRLEVRWNPVAKECLFGLRDGAVPQNEIETLLAIEEVEDEITRLESEIATEGADEQR
jgi:hypothetical protein